MKKILFTPSQDGYLIEILSYIPSVNFKGDVSQINAENILNLNFDGKFIYQNIKSDTLIYSEIVKGEIIKSHKSFKLNSKDISFRSALCPQTICDSYNSTGSSYFDPFCSCNGVQISAPSCHTIYYVCYPDIGVSGGPGGSDCTYCYNDPSGQPKKTSGNSPTSTKCACGNQTKFYDLNKDLRDPDDLSLIASYIIHLLINVYDCSKPSTSSYLVNTSAVFSVSGDLKISDIKSVNIRISAVNENDPNCGFYITEQESYNLRYIKTIDDQAGASIDLGKDIGKYGASTNLKRKPYDLSLAVVGATDKIKLD